MLATLSLLAWLYLFFAHGRFWSSRPELPPAGDDAGRGATNELPDVDIVVPARDEAGTIGIVVASLLRQDYAGRFQVTVVDDSSQDGTVAAAEAAAGGASNFRIVRADPKPGGWSGKLWALSEGITASSAQVLLFADADIVHDPRHLASLVRRLEQPRVELVSEMVRLNCTSPAERALIPAFVYFFQMLYPFARVNDPHSRVAAAAGGTVLIRRQALDGIGGIGAIRTALIDDVTLAKAIKKTGPIYLGHSGLATSIRPYPDLAAIWQMITRTAFTQLHYSATILLLTVFGLTLVWLVPTWELLFGRGWHFACGAAAFGLASISYLPTLARYRQNRLFCLALPLIASFYLLATVGSALNYWFGRGATWKNRAYGAASETEGRGARE